LQVETRVNEAVLDDLVPVFILQPLAENAVKHGVENQLGPTLIQISVQSGGAGEFLLLEISNDGLAGNLRLQNIKERVGLKNTRTRLHTIFGSSARLELLPRSGGGFVARIMIRRATKAAKPPQPKLQSAL
jgi:LytS/YehU family sensor histidine kinase